MIKQTPDFQELFVHLTKDFSTKRVYKTSFIGFFIISLCLVSLKASTSDAPLLSEDEILTTQKQSELVIDRVAHIQRYLMLKMPELSKKQVYQLSKLIFSLSKKYDLEPNLVLSVIQVESSFQVRALSPSGAIGLMQLMPQTGEWLAQQYGIPLENQDHLFEPSMNLRLGILYLAYLRNKFNGNLKMILSAYNRGPATVDAEILKGQDLALDYYHKVKKHLTIFASGI